MSKNELKVNETEMAVPDYIKQNMSRGSENVSSEDLLLPRIEVLQALSPQLNKRNAEYIEGAEVGMLINTLTGELYGNEIRVTPVHFATRYLVWVDRQKDANGGLRGVFDTETEAAAFIAMQDDKNKLESVRTAEHMVLLDDGSVAVISMSKSKQKVSRKWNSLVRLNGGDRFSRSYTLFSVEDKSPKGEFMNVDIKNAGFPSREVYEAAEAMYESIANGAINTNANYADGQPPEAADEY